MSKNINDKKVLVAGRNFITLLCTARSLGEAGYKVEVLHIIDSSFLKYLIRIPFRPMPDAHSKYVSKFYKCFKRENIVKTLIEIASKDEKKLLVPVDDLVVSIEDENYEELSNYYLMQHTILKDKSINELLDKDIQKSLAIKNNVPVVNGCAIKVKKDKLDNVTKKDVHFTIPKSINYPCFVKPNVSMTSAKSKMTICQNKEELSNVLINFMNAYEYSVMVEDYIDIECEYSLLGVCDGKDMIMPAFFRAELGESATHRGVAVTGRTLPISECDKGLYNNLCKLMKSLKYVGIFDIDLIKDKNGKMYFTEINFRIGASGYAFKDAGINLPKIFADFMFDNHPLDKKITNSNPNKLFVSERGLYNSYVLNSINKKGVDTLFKSADIRFIYDKNDPEPYKHFKKYYIPGKLLRLKNKLKNK